MKLPPWSASSLQSFESCPHKYYRLRIIKDVKDLPPSDQILLGRKVHTAFENAVNLGDALPHEYRSWQDLVNQIRALPGEKFPELKMAVDANFNPIDYYSKEAFSRGAADLVVLHGKNCAILDYKTGKRRESNQLALYAGYAFAKWPFLERVQTGYVWLKDHKIDMKTYTPEDKATIWNMWLPIVKRLEVATETNVWEKCPSGLCKKWCNVKDCDYCGV